MLKISSQNASFSHDGSVRSVEAAVTALDVWLTTEILLLLWIPTLGLKAQLQVQLSEFLYISGNYAKHSTSRLTGVSKRIAAILQEHGYDVPLDHIPLALEECGEHLQEDYVVYYGTWLVELLNSIRWGWQNYLMPTFRWSYMQMLGELKYTYKYPPNVVNDMSRAWFGRLMNHVRTGPFLHRFAGADYMKHESLR